jgi:hypothetical protein
MKRTLLFLTCLVAFGTIQSQDLQHKANAFLKSLTPELKSEAHFKLTDEERFNFNYVPMERKGPTFNDFNEKQKQTAMILLQTSLSKEGYRKTSEIMKLESVLRILENNSRKKADGSPGRDPLDYHFCIFGDPAPNSFWGWRFEGHHLSLNFVASEGTLVASTPTFFGTNPAIVKEGEHKGKEVLKVERTLGFSLVNSLNAQQLKIARFSDSAPQEIFTANNREATQLTPMGISYADLTADQQATLMKLLNMFIDNYESGFSKALRAKITKAGIDKLSFAWAGGLQLGTPHYYRIQGPTLLIEYDNIQNNANHVHAAVRDLTNDFGKDVLKEHYHEHH